MSTDPDARRVRPHPGWSLRTRVTAVVILVAVIVAGIGGLLGVQLIRSTLEDQAHERLSTALATLVGRSDPLGEATVAQIAGADVLWAIVPPRGAVRGPAARYVDDAAVQALRDGRPVSETARARRAPVVLEGVPVGGGGVVLATTEEEINRASRQLVARILTALAIGGLIAAAAGAWLARTIARPVRRAALAAERIADGQRSVPMPHSTIPEVSALTDALAALDRKLATSEGRQRDFLLSISHELRTPLTAIRGYAEGLADGTFGGDAAVRAGRVLEDETARLRRFVDDLLELARLEADDFAIDIRPDAPADLLRAARDTWLAAAARLEVGIELAIDPAADGLRLELDARRVRQILDGLIENALRVSPAGSTLTLQLAAEPGPAITVRDRGPGLTDADLAHAFDRNVLADRYRNTRPVGSGLGLSIAHRLAGRLGLVIQAGRPASGPGTVMTIRLPRRDAVRNPG